MQDVVRSGIQGLVVAGALAVLGASPSFAATAATPSLDDTQQARVDACFAQLERRPEDEAATIACLAESGISPVQWQRLVGTLVTPSLRQEQAQWESAAATALRTHAGMLALRGDARSLLAAVLLSPTLPSVTGEGAAPAGDDGSNAVIAWFDAARDIRPADPLVAWYEATGCLSAAMRCDREAAIGRLLATQPDNASVHLFALWAAQAAGDATAARTHLALAAAAPRYEPREQALMQLILAAGGDVAWPALSPELKAAAPMLRAQDMPVGGDDHLAMVATAQWAVRMSPLAGVRNLCFVAPDDAAALRQDCLTVMQRLATEGHSLVDQGIGLIGLMELAADEPDRAHWREQLRRYYWIYGQASNLMAPGRAQPPVDFVAHARLIAEHGELAAMRALLRERGIAEEPPADWLPDNPQQRARVTTGVPLVG